MFRPWAAIKLRPTFTGMIKSPKHFRLRALPVTLALALAAAACGSDDVAFDGLSEGNASITDASDVEFVEISPFARFGPAQGDFTAGEHGTFGIFGAGQASPPHTHSGAYYAVVLDGGEMNNPFGTEPNPATLPAGSFWSVPGDAEHITACLNPNEECRFFFHSAGAFDFFPLDSLTGERDSAAQSIPAGDLVFQDLEPYGAAALVWGNQDTGPHGTIVRIDAGSSTGELAHRAAFTAVPTVGSLSVQGDSDPTAMPIGSVLEMEANSPHSVFCAAGSDCLVYLFSDQALEVRS